MKLEERVLQNKKFILIAIFIVSLFAVSAVSAHENASTDVGSVGNAANGIVNGNMLAETPKEAPSSNPKTFTDLNITINSNNESEIYLNESYVYDSNLDSIFNEGITVNRSVIIYGNGHSIDGNGSARIFSVTNSNIVFKDIVFINAKRANNGGAIYWNGDNGEVLNCSFLNCSSAYTGGAIYWNGDNGSVLNCSFFNCSTNVGGSIYINKCMNATVAGCSFLGGSVISGGGAIYQYQGYGNVLNCNFGNCHADSTGGAIVWYSDEGTISNCSFLNCTSNYGGAIRGSGVNGFISNSSFVNCSVNDDGGAISWQASNGAVSRCSFVNCSADNGGAIRWTGSNGFVCKSNFTNCSAKNGGAIDWNGEDVFSCSFLNCSANFGGAIYVIGKHSGVFNCSFENSSAGYSGGAIVWNGDYGNLSACNFKNCSANGYGGAISWDGDNGIMTNSNFIICNANRGGAISGGSAKNCTFYGNNAKQGNNWYSTSVPKLNLIVPNLNSIHGSFEEILLNLTDNGGNKVNNIVITIRLYRNDTFIDSLELLGNEKWNVNLDIGSYVAVMTIEHEAYEFNEPVTPTLTITGIPTSISSNSVATVYNGGKYLVAVLRDNEGNPLSGVKLSLILSNGKSINKTTDDNGQFKWSTDGLMPAKTYIATITFDGNATHEKSSISTKVTVKKATPKLTAKVKTFKKSIKTKKYSMTLKTNNNKAMKNAKVYIKVNKKTYMAKTNGKGTATFKMTKLTKKGKYAAIITYKGSSYYNKLTKKVKIVIK